MLKYNLLFYKEPNSFRCVDAQFTSGLFISVFTLHSDTQEKASRRQEVVKMWKEQTYFSTGKKLVVYERMCCQQHFNISRLLSTEEMLLSLSVVTVTLCDKVHHPLDMCVRSLFHPLTDPRVIARNSSSHLTVVSCHKLRCCHRLA